MHGLLHLPLPSLISLHVYFEKSPWFWDSLDLTLHGGPPPNAISLAFSIRICQWQNLETVVCPEVALDVAALTHLAHTPTLTRLAFAVMAKPLTFNSPLIFSNLHDLTLRSHALYPIPRLFTWIRLPAITDLSVLIDNSLSGEELSSFFASVQTSGMGHIIQGLWLSQLTSRYDERNPLAFQIYLDSLRPCMAFSDLRCINLIIDWDVFLTDSDMLTLASAWPHLESLFINLDWGWNTGGGITPDGLLKLLQACPSLSRVGVPIDTQGYTECIGSPGSLGLTSSRTFYINVLDSVIAVESVPAIAAYFANIALCCRLCLTAWNSWVMALEDPTREVYMNRWGDVLRQLGGAIGRHP